MRRTYTCLLELADAAGSDPVKARALTKRWVGGQYGTWPEHASSPWRPVPGVSVEWRVLRDPERDDEGFELVWTRPDRRDPTLWWRTAVQITVAARDLGRVVVREQLESADPKVREATVDRAHRPDLVVELVRSVRCVDGGWPVRAEPVHVDAERALELDAFVRGDRRLPVVLVAPGADGEVRADAAGFADELAGLAHVVVLAAPAAVAALAAELGSGRGVQPGGVRLLWPEWRSGDPASRHPAWREEEVTGARVRDVLCGLVIPAAALRVEDDPLVARLARTRPAAELRARRVELERARHEAARSHEAAEALVGDYQAELSIADGRVAELEELLEQEQEVARRAMEWYLALSVEGRAGPPPRSARLVDVMRRAAVELPHLVVLPDALRSAQAWQYDDTEGLWLDLVGLELVATEWERGELGGSFGDACRARGLDWAGGVAEDTRQRHRSAYTRTYQEVPILLGPHLRRGGRQLLRVYCYLDRSRHRVVVGHVGAHLPDSTT